MVELVYVSADKITLKGVVPEMDPNYDGRDPLNQICWQIKDKLLSEHNVCVCYQIDRKVNLNGERSIDISLMMSYTGKYEGSNRVPEDESYWTNVFSYELASLLEAFILDFSHGEKCELIKDPVRSLKFDPHEFENRTSKKKEKKKRKKKLQATDASKATAEMEAAGFRKPTNNDMPALPDDVFVDED